jgi:hypothetical protein
MSVGPTLLQEERKKVRITRQIVIRYAGVNIRTILPMHWEDKETGYDIVIPGTYL